jgi:hypothetical protein
MRGNIDICPTQKFQMDKYKKVIVYFLHKFHIYLKNYIYYISNRSKDIFHLFHPHKFQVGKYRKVHTIYFLCKNQVSNH